MLIRERKRVCYIESRPEWFSYAVLRLFYRNQNWLFVPLRDLSETERKVEYQKAQYFFISGFGHAQQAKDAEDAGCILVGVRCDVSNEIPIMEAKPWDPFGVFAIIIFNRQIGELPNFLQPIAKYLTIFFTRIYWYLYFTYQTLVNENWQNLVIKAKIFFNR